MTALAAASVAANAAASAKDSPAAPRAVGLLRARLAYPQRVSAAVGGLFFREAADRDCSIFCAMRGPHVQLDVGLAGAEFGAGYAYVVAKRPPGRPFLNEVYLGYGLRAALLRTWGEAPFDPPTRDFAGVELAFSVGQVSFTLGCFRQISEGAGEGGWRWTGGMGWGF